jgi:ComF family protein
MRATALKRASDGAAALRRWLRPACAVCSLARGFVCPACEADFFSPSRWRCRVCALPLQAAADVCGGCLARPPHFHRTTALADYAPPVDGMVMALKFGARLDLASVFGHLLGQRAQPPDGALVIAVPLAYERMSERGFNQSLQIARAYCAATGARLATDAIRRIRHAPPQQSLALADRRRNIRGAFSAVADLAHSSVLVVDDVMTTGSTMDEVARVLIAAGAVHVHALVVARTP